MEPSSHTVYSARHPPFIYTILFFSLLSLSRPVSHTLATRAWLHISFVRPSGHSATAAGSKERRTHEKKINKNLVHDRNRDTEMNPAKRGHTPSPRRRSTPARNSVTQTRGSNAGTPTRPPGPRPGYGKKRKATCRASIVVASYANSHPYQTTGGRHDGQPEAAPPGPVSLSVAHGSNREVRAGEEAGRPSTSSA